ncbi:MAG TPA: accessory factor UbiK family protein [Acidisoma sp.]|nr:accessory factor UbiK family protein [Acidisoma sp.]
MKERGRFMDDLAGVAQGALSAFGGLRDEAEAVFAARVEAVIHKLDIARGEQLAAIQELAANTRLALSAAEAEIASLKARVAVLESQGASAAAPAKPEAEHAKPAIDPATAWPQDVPATHPQDPPLGTAGNDPGLPPAAPIS